MEQRSEKQLPRASWDSGSTLSSEKKLCGIFCPFDIEHGRDRMKTNRQKITISMLTERRTISIGYDLCRLEDSIFRRQNAATKITGGPWAVTLRTPSTAAI